MLSNPYFHHFSWSGVKDSHLIGEELLSERIQSNIRATDVLILYEVSMVFQRTLNK